jgi:ATP adenylyltransferase
VAGFVTGGNRICGGRGKQGRGCRFSVVSCRADDVGRRGQHETGRREDRGADGWTTAGGGAADILAGMDFLWTPWRYAYVTDEKQERAGVPAALAAWPGDKHCVFCNLLAATAYAVEHGMDGVAADRAARIVARGERTFVVLNAYPYASGHVMVVPVEHVDELGRLDAETAAEVMRWAQRVDGVLRETYRPDGINMGLNMGKAAGAGVQGHLHLHALPRWLGDTNFMTVVGETRVVPESLETTWERLHAGLGK